MTIADEVQHPSSEVFQTSETRVAIQRSECDSGIDSSVETDFPLFIRQLSLGKAQLLQMGESAGFLAPLTWFHRSGAMCSMHDEGDSIPNVSLGTSWATY